MSLYREMKYTKNSSDELYVNQNDSDSHIHMHAHTHLCYKYVSYTGIAGPILQSAVESSQNCQVETEDTGGGGTDRGSVGNNHHRNLDGYTTLCMCSNTKYGT